MVVSVFLGAAPLLATEANYTQLKSFGLPGQAGVNPIAPLVPGGDGVFYGTSYGGGSGGAGTVFRMGTNGSGFAVLRSFLTTGGDGQNPQGGVVLGRDGALYGTTYNGGASGKGAIFRLDADGQHYAVLRSFNSTAGDGQNPWELIQGADGALYGTTYSGGASNAGTVFKINCDGSAYTVLYEFGAAAGDAVNPKASVIQGADGLLYGTTFKGGTNSGAGTVFRLTTNGTDFAILHHFNFAGGEGYYPYAPVVQGLDGALYGTTYYGGSNNAGIVFRMNVDGSNYAILRHLYSGAGDARNPYARLTPGADGTLFGTTYNGGSASAGAIFKLGPDGSDYAVIHSFSNTGGDGQNPQAPLWIDRDGTIYGTARNGGSAGGGSGFRLAPDGSGYTALWNFSLTGGDGQKPYGGLIRGRDGAWYGTTSSGGTTNVGAIFRMNADGSSYTVLRSFSNLGGDGQAPYAALVQGADDFLYGTTQVGGSNNYGTVFRLATDGSGYGVLHHFTLAGGDGRNPWAALIQADDGMLYGTTYNGGSSGYGTVFKIDPDGGNYSVVRSFGTFTGDGKNPQGALLQGSDGALYGTTVNGGSSGGYGTVFKLNRDGSGYAVLRSFSNTGNDPQNPQAALIEGDGGILFGTTYNGGTAGKGTLFSLPPDGTAFTVLWNFGSIAGDGWNPQAALVRGRIGLLYGVTYNGGANSAGTIFKLAPDGSGYEVLHSLGAAVGEGKNPRAALCEGPDLGLRGTTAAGGDMSLGTVFEFSFGLPGFAVPPVSQAVLLGSTATFNCLAAGPPPLSYQWQFNGANLPDATNAVLTVPNVTTNNFGTYTVTVTNPYGSVTSNPVTLSRAVWFRLISPIALPDGSLRLAVSFVGGGTVTPDDLPRFEAQASTNLAAWVTLTNALSVVAEQLVLTDPERTDYAARFYRVLLH